MHVRGLVLLVVLCGWLASQGSAQQKAAPDGAASEKPGEVQLEFGVRIPLRDGVRLNASVWRPMHATKPLPVIFLLSPYPDDTSHPSGSYFAQRGYVYAYVDVRGRGSSEGTFDPLAQEAKDGADVVEWFARQPWCDGHVAMWGGSYAGYDQWATAGERPAHLSTIIPTASARPGADFPLGDGLWTLYVMQWLTLTSGRALNSALFADGDYWSAVQKRLYRDKAAYRRADEYAGNRTTVFPKWVAHPEFDDYWREIAVPKEKVARVAMPVLTITGALDGDQPGAMSFYRDHMATTDATTRADSYLVIGPWDHAGTREPKRNVGKDDLGEGSVIDMRRLNLQWYDSVIKGGAMGKKRPAFLSKPVVY